MNSALFINGIHNSVLAEILNAQESRGGGESFLQPYKAAVVVMLRNRQPTPQSSVRLYVSTAKNLNQVCYTAEIIGWEDKRELSEQRRTEVGRHHLEYQPEEVTLFAGVGEIGRTAVNLISIRDLKRLDPFYAIWVVPKGRRRRTPEEENQSRKLE